MVTTQSKKSFMTEEPVKNHKINPGKKKTARWDCIRLFQLWGNDKNTSCDAMPLLIKPLRLPWNTKIIMTAPKYQDLCRNFMA